ncbi:DUF3499 domain-containing protein [Arthrobacter sp. AQ5-05]|uniref:DUF3499 domain-containing protein n=1 Tax=Arthrobacter sp. AQ5-05 TaxID=2184581 RepID=UPI000DCE12FD|nr:DUF3499 domain-containing protein [Arthrobacter sp. AQ5-05]RAX50716.1 DUF3499 domain-containing protein [Arthrobacter sp. AQ5-05]
MGSSRLCSRSACRQPAIATLTYVYADSTAVLGPLATYAEPHCYDLCDLHAQRLTAPLGWQVLRLALPEQGRLRNDDLYALANAVREDEAHAVAAPPLEAPSPRSAPPAIEPGDSQSLTRRHLRVLREGNLEP